jgi:aryl-alcohol dehydrogenase-like predicted oxidoreductase
VRYHLLGQTGLYVSEICLGTMTYGGGKGIWENIGALPQDAVDEQVRFAVDAGINFIDTANVYSLGKSEALLGQALKTLGLPRRNLIIATKATGVMDDTPNGRGQSRHHIFNEVDASLKRLQTDYIDLYQAHEDDPGTPLDETLSAFDILVRAGKVRFIGASNYTGARLAEAIETSRRNGVAAYVSLQPHYNLVERQPFESDLLPVVEKYGLGVIPYFSLASGFLTGKYTRGSEPFGSARAGMVKKYLNDHGFAVVDALEEVAAAHRSSPASVALAWLLAQPGITAPIASATSDRQFEALIAATTLELDPEGIRRLTEVSAAVAA